LKNSAYTKLRSEVDILSQNASGKNSNAAAVKLLFIRNKILLQNLYGKAGLQNAEAMTANTKRLYVFNPKGIQSKLVKYIKLPSATTLVRTAPYDDDWKRTGYPNGNMPAPFDTAASNFGTGKIAITSNPCNNTSYCYLGTHSTGFLEKIKVPSDPYILAAQIKFDYSFDYTGWDTYGAKTAIDLVVKASDNFNSATYKELPNGPVVFSNFAYKKAGVLLLLDSIITDFGELHASANASFTMEGYVTPGTDIELHFGFSFPVGTNKGLNGCYHYGEFILKKITVSYYKSAN